ncbi:FAD-dependent oxidoreductase [Microbacterium sp.]|uniref:FAD-dependent oxidoreductase n=1 Tax=Microbacterium sp. TaxID=51671 RepID=UPI0025E39537|nr:FAD-dependent oxidoreductase [Microbacterium sp.]
MATTQQTSADETRTQRAQVCIAGGGPAGVMLGLLLARAGIEVVVLEKHADFFRDFRGDTVHPSTLNIIDALGLRSEFDAIPHTPLPRLDAVINGIRIHAIDLSTLPPPNRMITLMPQWDLLQLLARAGERHPSFRLRMNADVTGVIERGGRVVGVRADTPDGELVVEADLVVAADGRSSTVRPSVGLTPREYGVPSDVLWFRLPRPTEKMPDTLLWAGVGGFVITIPRPDYLQCGLLIPHGTFPQVQGEGLEAFRQRITRVVPRLTEVVGVLASLDDVKLLSVQIDRLDRWWRPGMLAIGDAAHAMSPVFGVGINYAVQDAVAAARVLAPALSRGGADALDAACAAVQRRRERPTAMMQAIQRAAHRLIASGRRGRIIDNPPTRVQRAVLRLVLPTLRPLMARLIGYGFRPERV